MKTDALKVTAGTTIYASTGMFGRKQPDRMSTEAFYLADAGSRLQLLDKKYLFNVATYTLDFDAKYMHTYDYAPDEAWLTYAGDLGRDTYRQQDYVFRDRRYFRVCLKRVDGHSFLPEEAGQIQQILRFTSTAEEKKPQVFFEEVHKTLQQLEAIREPDDLVLAVLTDTHRTVNGTWEDTLANLQAVQEDSAFDGVVHLGDFTDGVVSRELTGHYVHDMLAGLRQSGVPVYVVLGNHDANYFAGNPDVLPLWEQTELYQSGSATGRECLTRPYYYKDMAARHVRCIFLSAYENQESLRYGFDLEQIAWLAEVLHRTPDDFGTVIFSHDAPLAELDFWADQIRHSEEIMQVMEEHQQRHGNIMAFIHGHTHADCVFRERAFPIVSIGCAKCEDMLEKKPDWSVTAKRVLGTATQELWDIVVIKAARRELHFIRFGAGENRVLK